MAKEAFNRKISLLISKLNVELKMKLIKCCVFSISLHGSETWTLKIEAEVFGEHWNVMLEESGEDRMVRENN